MESVQGNCLFIIKSDHIISHHIIYLKNQFNRNIENGFQSNLFQLVVHLSTPFEDLFDEFLHHLLPLHSSLIERDVSLKKYICGLLVSAAFAGSVLHQYPRSGLPVQIPFPLHSVMEISIWNINEGSNLVRIVAHPVTEKMTSVGCCNFNRFHEPTVWPGSSVAFSKDNRSVTFKNSSRSFFVRIVL